LTTRSPIASSERNSSIWRVGTRNEPGASLSASVPAIRASRSVSLSATAYAAGKNVSVVA